jgi:hypothetical protein
MSIYLAFGKYLKGSGHTRCYISYLYVDCASIKRRSLYDILIKYGVVRLIKACIDVTRSKVRIGNYFSSSFPIENGLKPGDALSSLLFNFAPEYAIRDKTLD